jgi:uncharacterized membrane protein YhhN
MQKQLFNKWLYTLLLIPLTSAILALLHFGFFFQAGVAAAGILILLIVYFKQLKVSGDVWMVMAAFLFSIGGDWFLSNKKGDTGMFIAGILLFLFAHAGYLAYALMNGRIHRTVNLAVLAAYLVFFFTVLYPSIDDKVLMLSALVYLLISCVSLGAAAGLQTAPLVKWAFIFGIFLILFSDTIIAFREFVKYRELNFLILPTYYLAQISITFALMKKQINI